VQYRYIIPPMSVYHKLQSGRKNKETGGLIIGLEDYDIQPTETKM